MKDNLFLGHLKDTKIFDLILEHDHGKIQAAKLWHKPCLYNY